MSCYSVEYQRLLDAIASKQDVDLPPESDDEWGDHYEYIHSGQQAVDLEGLSSMQQAVSKFCHDHHDCKLETQSVIDENDVTSVASIWCCDHFTLITFDPSKEVCK